MSRHSPGGQGPPDPRRENRRPDQNPRPDGRRPDGRGPDGRAPPRAPAGAGRFGPYRDAPAFGDRSDQRKPPKPPGNAPELIHRDRDLLVVVKEPGQPTRRAQGVSLVAAVHDHLTTRRERYRPVHDLDDAASGVVALVPITDDDDLREIRSSVTYLALVQGDFDTGDSPDRSITGPVPGLPGKSSAPVTSVRRLAGANGLMLVRVRARPDAPSQIRTHLASVGCPVLGDTQHASTRDDIKRVALHAEELRIRHPKSGLTQRYRCPAPASFYAAVGEQPPPDAPGDEAATPKDRGWEQVAGWYDDLITSGSSDHHDRTVLPGVEQLLDLQPNERILDIACGQGVLCARLAQRHAPGAIVGVDSSPALLDAARKRLPEQVQFLLADARALHALDLQPFDAAACVLALMNIDDLDGVCAGVASRLAPGGRFVAVVLHPAFRAPRDTSWGWTTDPRTNSPVQFRRVDAYLTRRDTEIIMNPGQAAAGKQAVVTVTHHRPISAYVNALTRAGLLVDTMAEWASERSSRPGPRAAAENTARAEIPMFLALRARKTAFTPP